MKDNHSQSLPDVAGIARSYRIINGNDFFLSLRAGAPAFFAKAEMGSVRFQQRKICWRLLPSAARVRPASAAAHNSPSVRCTPLAYANDLTPCRMALHFDYASAIAPTSSKRPAPTATRGSSYTAPLALRFLYSFIGTVRSDGQSKA